MTCAVSGMAGRKILIRFLRRQWPAQIPQGQLAPQFPGNGSPVFGIVFQLHAEAEKKGEPLGNLPGRGEQRLPELPAGGVLHPLAKEHDGVGPALQRGGAEKKVFSPSEVPCPGNAPGSAPGKSRGRRGSS